MTALALMQWDFASSPATLLLAAAGLGLAVWLWRMHCTRSQKGRGYRLLETFRLVIVVCLLFTLFKPELIRTRKSEKRDAVVVLVDRSLSLRTRDARDAEGRAIDRAAALEHAISNTSWQALQDSGDLVFKDFAPPYSSAGTDIAGALTRTVGEHPRMRALILLSDGDWTSGDSPLIPADLYADRETPILSGTVGSEAYLPDLALEAVRAPAYGLLDENVVLLATIQSHISREIRTRLNLEGSDGTRIVMDVRIPARARVIENVVIPPRKAGPVSYTLRVDPAREEVDLRNNQAAFTIAYRQELLRVLLVESRPRWEYRFLRNALTRDPGIEVDCLLLHPKLAAPSGEGYIQRFPETIEALQDYDVVFLGDVGIGSAELSAQNAKHLAGLVEQHSSGIVFIPGLRDRQRTLADSALGELLPVRWDENATAATQRFGKESHLQLTRRGAEHLLTTLADSAASNTRVWKSLPGFYWHAPVLKSSPGTRTLAVHESRRNAWGRIPLLVVGDHGSGRTLFLGTDGAWRWRRGVEDVYHYRFWGQVVRWMAHKRHQSYNRNLRLITEPESPHLGDTVSLHAIARDASGAPYRAETLTLSVRTPHGTQDQVTLARSDEAWGTYSAYYVPEQPGSHTLRLQAPGLNPLEMQLAVEAPELERTGAPARPGVLQDLARVTDGQSAPVASLQTLVDAAAHAPIQTSQETRLQLWSNPVWGGIILLMLTAYWVGRKAQGVI